MTSPNRQFAGRRRRMSGSYAPLRRTYAGAIAVGSAITVLFALAAFRAQPPGSSPPQGLLEPVAPHGVHGLRDRPIFLSPRVPSGFGLPRDELASIVKQVTPSREGASASFCLHLLMARGLDAQFDDHRLPSGREVLRLFTDDNFSKAYFGRPSMFRTGYGVRPTMPKGFNGAEEAHYDQNLACMAKLGLPLSLPIRIEGRSFTLGDVLRDSIACFELRQSEIEWTVTAYALYLAPRQAWVNKFGEQYSFDELAQELLGRNPGRASCYGCHLFEAMSTLLRVDREVGHVLSREMYGQLAERLGEGVRSAVSTQDNDGSWGPDWYKEVAWPGGVDEPTQDLRSAASRLLATSHVVSLVMCLPGDLHRAPVAPEVINRAGAWLHAQLKGAQPSFVRENFCACSHAVAVLRLLCGDSVLFWDHAVRPTKRFNQCTESPI